MRGIECRGKVVTQGDGEVGWIDIRRISRPREIVEHGQHADHQHKSKIVCVKFVVHAQTIPKA
jgi:hypothetical protein